MATNFWEKDAVVSEQDQWWKKDSVVGGKLTQGPSTPEPPKEQSAFRQVADVPLSVGKGALSGIRMIADAFGAGSKASESIKGAENYLSSLMSAQAKNDEQEIARIMKDAEDKGVLDQVKAGLKAFTVAPVDLISQGLGTAAPALLGLLGGKVLGAGALGARAIGAGIGAGMGAGTAKGNIYEATKEELVKAGLPEDQAEKRAQEAQAYGGKNLDQILLSTGLGAFASSTGLESATRRILMRGAAKQAAKETVERGLPAAAKAIGKGTLAEAAPEFVQAGQEQVAQNVALQREGFDVPTFRGAVGAGTLEALAGAGLGAGFSAAEVSRGGLREKAKEDAARILEQERAAQEPAPPITPAVREEPEMSLEDIERAAGIASVREEPQTVEELIAEEPVAKAPEAPAPAPTAPAAPAAPVVAAETAEPAAPAVEETPQQKFDRLSKMRLKVANAFRDGIITNQEFEKFQADLDAAREAAKSAPVDLSQLSPAKREILELADKIEAAGQKGFADGMRGVARPEAREPDQKNMEFYREKLASLLKTEAVKAGEEKVEQVAYGLPEFFADTPKDAERIAGLRKSGPNKVRIALDEINDAIQTLADTIAAAGYRIDKVSPGQAPPAILRIKSQIGTLAAGANRLSSSAEAVQKGYKRADPKRVKADIEAALADITKAEELIAAQPNVPTAAEQMEGVAVPPSPEVQDLREQQRKAEEDMARIKKRGTSLWTALAGRLSGEEVRGLGGRNMKVGKNQFLNLAAKRGKPSTDLSDLVADGILDAFLPPNMRHDAAQFDNQESTEYIREKLVSGNYTTHETQMAVETIGQEVLEIERRIQEELSLEDINREIQVASDEQREADQAVADFAAEGEAGAAAERKAEEATELDDLEKRAADAGIDVDAIREQAYYDTRGEEDGMYERTLADRLRGALDAQEQFLAVQTEKDLKAKEELRKAKEKAEQERKRADEEKAKADEAAADFVLTGSDRAADQAAARGQMELAPAEEERPATYMKAVEAAGFKKLPRGSDRAYKDASGKEYTTLERDGVRVVLRSGMALSSNDRGGVDVYQGDPNEWIVQALIVDPDRQNRGLANQAMQDITGIADEYGIDLYLEPTPIEGGQMSKDQLGDFYSRFGFDYYFGRDVMLRRANEAPKEQVARGEEVLSASNEAAREAYYKASKEGADVAKYKFSRLLDAANSSGSPVNVWSFDGELRSMAWDQTPPKYARLVATVNPEEKLKTAEKGQTGYSPDPEEQRVEKELTGKTMIQAADWAIQNAPNAFVKTIAEKVRNRLRELERRGVKLEFEVVGGDRRPRSLYDARGYMQPDWGNDTKDTTLRLVLNGAAVMNNQAGYPPGTRYSTVLHELLHVATRGYLQFAPLSDPLRRQMRDLTNAIIERYNSDAKAGKLPPVMQKYYKRMNNVLESDDEVLAWGLTDEDVQKYFADIKVGEKSVMTRLVELVRSVLGLGKQYESALDRLVKVSESMLDMDVSAIDAVLGNAGKRLGRAAPTTGEQRALFQKEGREPSIAYHSGDLKFGKDTVLGRMMGGRSTGHFGTGVYFVGDKSKLKDTFGLREGRSIQEVDFSKYNLFTPATNYGAERLHKALRKINNLAFDDITDKEEFKEQIKEATNELALATGESQSAVLDAVRKHLEKTRDLAEKNAFESTYIPTLATEVMQELGYDGIDVRRLDKYDNTEYGSVIYAKEITPETKSEKAKTPQTETAAFKRWFGDSKIVNADGSPRVLYHGTKSNFTEFRPRGELIFVSTSPEFASKYAEPSIYKDRINEFTGEEQTPSVMPVYVRAENPFDFRDPEQLEMVVEEVRRSVPSFQEVDEIQFGYWATLESDQVRGAIKRLGFDSLYITEKGAVNLAVFDPKQLKSAIGNQGTFDPNDPNILRQQEGRQNVLGEVTPGNWTLQPDTKLDTGDSVVYKMLDKNIDLKRVVNAIKGTGREIATRWNPYLKEELYHGRTAKQTQDFMSKEVKPLIEEMDRDGVTIGEFEQYLHNRHAEAYNKHVAKVNPNTPEMQDGGSGITTEAARKYLADLPADKKKVYESLAKRIDEMTKGTRELLVESGLEKRETIDAWEKTFPDYVPLMREEEDFEYTTNSFGVGQGFDVRGSFSKRAMGSKRNVVDILANAVLSRERAIVKAEKNRVAQAVYGLAIQNGNPNFWMAVNPLAEKIPQVALDELAQMNIDPEAIQFLMKEPRQRAIDPKKNEVISRINSRLRDSKYVLSMRLNGEDRYVFFNPNNERAKRAATALKNLDAQQLGAIMGFMGRITRYMAAMNTQYNPIFGAYNFLRDVQGAAFQLSTTPIAGKQKEVGKNVLPAMKAIFQSLRKGEPTDTEMGRLWEDFQKAGGQTGFRDMYSRSQDRAEALLDEFKKMSEGRIKKAGRYTFQLLSDYNDTMENAVRLSAYKVALENGFNKDEAASIAKNLTVNFNRKGDIAVQAGALYAFFNASMQGTARLIETLKGPLGKKIVYGGLLWGVMQSVLLAAAGFDEEEPPEFVRERNFIIPIFGTDKYIAFPMPLGYHVIPGTSRIVTDAVLNYAGVLKSSKTMADRVTELTGMFLEAFNPIGNAGWSAQTLFPTPTDPIIALFENKDWTGKKISREDFSDLDPTPGYTRAKESATYLGTQIAKFLNLATGGTKYQPGIISPTPEQLEYLAGQAFGGVGREIGKIVTTTEKLITGEELPPYKIPLAGRFYGETKSSAAEANRFYKNLEQLNKLENEIKGRRENKEPLGSFMADNPEARLIRRAESVYSDVKKLRERKEKLVERGASRESVKVVEEQITRKMRMLNEQVENAKK